MRFCDKHNVEVNGANCLYCLAEAREAAAEGLHYSQRVIQDRVLIDERETGVEPEEYVQTKDAEHAMADDAVAVAEEAFQVGKLVAETFSGTVAPLIKTLSDRMDGLESLLTRVVAALEKEGEAGEKWVVAYGKFKVGGDQVKFTCPHCATEREIGVRVALPILWQCESCEGLIDVRPGEELT